MPPNTATANDPPLAVVSSVFYDTRRLIAAVLVATAVCTAFWLRAHRRKAIAANKCDNGLTLVTAVAVATLRPKTGPSPAVPPKKKMVGQTRRPAESDTALNTTARLLIARPS